MKDDLEKKVKKSRSKSIIPKTLDGLKEENEMLRLQIMAREKERDEYKKELEEIHDSISYKIGRWISETKIGGWLKKFLKKNIWK